LLEEKLSQSQLHDVLLDKTIFLLTIIFKANSINTTSFPVHGSVHYPRLDMENTQFWVLKGQRIPKSNYREFGNAI
jgi:hypothetical protein